MPTPAERKPATFEVAGSQEIGNAGRNSKSENSSKRYQRQARWRDRNPEKVWCHVAFQSAMRRGLVVRQPCEVCGDPKSEAHHPDYTRPAVVKWYCRLHHKAEHRRLKCEAVT